MKRKTDTTAQPEATARATKAAKASKATATATYHQTDAIATAVLQGHTSDEAILAKAGQLYAANTGKPVPPDIAKAYQRAVRVLVAFGYASHKDDALALLVPMPAKPKAAKKGD